MILHKTEAVDRSAYSEGSVNAFMRGDMQIQSFLIRLDELSENLNTTFEGNALRSRQNQIRQSKDMSGRARHRSSIPT